MSPTVSATMMILMFSLGGAPAGEALFLQVHPRLENSKDLRRTTGRRRAVVLLHGLKLHPFSAENAAKPALHGWQEPGSALVSLLGEGADVFAFAYAQTAPVEKGQLEVLAKGWEEPGRALMSPPLTATMGP